MATPTAKPKKSPATPYAAGPEPLHIVGGWIWAPLQGKWLVKKGEELVRQGFIYRLHAQWGYALEQMAQERRTAHGHKSPKADIVVAESAEALRENRDYIIVVETKAENITIVPADYEQGDSYARAVGAEFLVMHNEKETSFFRITVGAPGQQTEITAIPRLSELANSVRLEEIRRSTKPFTRTEFQRLLFECHSILRDNHKMDPGAAFDEISKILFIKMAYERQGQSDVFTTDRLRAIAASSLKKSDDEQVLVDLFETTKGYYKGDKLFSASDKLEVSLATFERIVKKLEVFNLSDTGDDVKGIAFESFLGRTFRGELGQFFTPRPLVDFMVEMLDPQEGEVICDPAAGTGGFLIRVFEHLRSRVERNVQDEKTAAVAAIEVKAAKEHWPDEQLDEALEAARAELNRQLDITNPESRLYKIAHDCIYGTDAAARAARTSKMNMIMHGDGHGGIHYHDGLLDVNGIYEGRFDVVLTNPPFGGNVGKDQVIGATEQTLVDDDLELLDKYKRLYGDEWLAAHTKLVASAKSKTPILGIFDIGRDPIGGDASNSRVRPNRATEQLFIERCLNLLKPGGRVGIVLPEGILNNPSLAWLREYVEGRAQLLAVVSVPQEVFASAKATVKTSIVFLRRFTDQQVKEWDAAQAQAEAEVQADLADQRKAAGELYRRAETFDRPELADLVDEVAVMTQATTPDTKSLRLARAALRKMLTDSDKAAKKVLERAYSTLAKELDTLEAQRVRARTRELTSYPVFMAEVQSAGITGTGDTGPDVPNDLPTVTKSFHEFVADPDAFTKASAARLAAQDEKAG